MQLDTEMRRSEIGLLYREPCLNSDYVELRKFPYRMVISLGILDFVN